MAARRGGETPGRDLGQPKPSMKPRAPASDLEETGIVLAATTIGIVTIWTINNLGANSAGTLATWVVVSLAMLATSLVALARKGRHAGWLHPLSISFATVTVMSLGTILWVYFTHQAVGLLYVNGDPPTSSTLAVAVSATACEALTMAVIGYVIGVGAAFAPTTRAEPNILDEGQPVFRYGDMRTAGLAIMAIGATSQLAVSVLARRAAYGASQLQYGLPSDLGSGAAIATLVGLTLVTITATPSDKHNCLWALLTRREWAILCVFLLSIAVTGERAGLIAPIVYMAWIYSSHVRAIPLKRMTVGLLLALTVGTIIASYRHNNGISDAVTDP